jgi:hypothetical protein
MDGLTLYGQDGASLKPLTLDLAVAPKDAKLADVWHLEIPPDAEVLKPETNEVFLVVRYHVKPNVLA